MLILYENFNTSNQTQPRYEAHENFVADIKEAGCSLVETLDYSERCNFVKKSQFCIPEVQTINYLEFFYCTLSPSGPITQILGIIVICLMLSYLFLILGFIADKFFCPSLTMLSKTLRMSEALAGVTLLAFGNGAPDLFTAMASLTDTKEIGLQYSELVGAASFVSGVVAGSIIIVSPFQIFAATCVRDYLFFIFALLYIDMILLTDGLVTIAESIGVLVVYIVYITVVCVDQYIYSKDNTDKAEIKKESLRESLANSLGSKSIISYERRSTLEFLAKRSSPTNNSPARINVITQLLKTISPIKLEEWKEAGICGRFCQIVQIPLCVLTIVTPITNYDDEFDGWSKLLNCFQLIFALPIFIELLLEETFHILSLNVLIILTVIMVPVAVIVYRVTRANKAPKFHFVWAIFATALSIGLISFVANEIIFLLMLLGVLINANSSFLGCTLLAWGNSVGDLVTNITLAKQGYQKMGFAACIGGPLFNIITSIGIAFLYKSIKNPGTNSLSAGALSTTNLAFLLIILSFTLLAFVLTNFFARRSIGYFLITLYLICFTFTILNTLDYIHPYGTDHSEESGF